MMATPKSTSKSTPKPAPLSSSLRSSERHEQGIDAVVPQGVPGDAIRVGHIAGAWGVRGALKVAPQSTDAGALLSAKSWWLVAGQEARLFTVGSSKRHGDGVVATLEGVDDRNAAEARQGAAIFVARSDFPRAALNEYYWVDLLGCQVLNRDRVLLGEVLGLIDTGVHSVLRVGARAASVEEPSAGAEHASTERLIPFVAAYVDAVDLSSRRIDVDWGMDY